MSQCLQAQPAGEIEHQTGNVRAAAPKIYRTQICQQHIGGQATTGWADQLKAINLVVFCANEI